MTSQSGGGGVPSGVAGGVLGGTYPSPSFATNGTTPILGVVSSILSGAVSMTNANQFYTGVSVGLTAGTWLIFAWVGVNTVASGGTQITFRLNDGTSSLASGQATNGTNSIGGGFLSCLYVAAGAVSVSIQAALNAAGGSLISAAATNGVGNNACQIIALRVA